MGGNKVLPWLLVLAACAGGGDDYAAECVGEQSGSFDIDGLPGGFVDAELDADGALRVSFVTGTGTIAAEGEVSPSGRMSGEYEGTIIDGTYDFATCSGSGDWQNALSEGGFTLSQDGDGDADTDVDTDTDGDTDADTDSDADADTDGDTDADTDSDTDADADTDADTDGDTDADTDADTDTGGHAAACAGSQSGVYDTFGTTSGVTTGDLEADGTLFVTFTSGSGDVDAEGFVAADGSMSGTHQGTTIDGTYDFSSCSGTGDWSNIVGISGSYSIAQ